jgi:predicted peroxiredoxin
MADKLLIIMANSQPDNVKQLISPLSQAMTAAAMEFDVEMVFTGNAGAIVKNGQAEKLALPTDPQRNVYHLIQEAHAAGVKFKVCTTDLEVWGDDLIPEVSETVGGAYLISEAMDDGTVVFTY